MKNTPTAKATIKQVATKAQVSIATVSRVINASGTVSDELQAKVNKAIAELNFTPNSLARSLKTKKTKTIGVLIVNLYLPFFSSIVHHLEKNLRSLGYNMFVSSHHDDVALEKRCLDYMLEMQVDAILVTSTCSNDAYLADIHQKGTPVLFLDRTSATQDLPFVCTDKKTGFYLLTQHLYQLGHRSFGMVAGNQNITSNLDRALGFFGFIQEAGLNPKSMPCRYGPFVGTAEFGYQTAQELFRQRQGALPTAFLLGNTTITYGFLRYFQEQGIAVPQDVSIVTLGDFYMPDLINIKLTHMDDEQEELGKLGATLICSLLKDPFGKQESIQLPPKIILGNSTGQAKAPSIEGR